MERQKKVFILILVLATACLYSFTSFAETVVNKALLVEQAKGKAPNVKAYMTGSDMSDTVSVSGSIEDIDLTQDGNIKTFDASGESIRYIILFDNSASINRQQFDVAKLQLSQMRRNMKNEDELILYTVGTTDVTSDKVNVLGRTALATQKDQLESDCEQIENIEYVKASISKTILYRSLNEVLEEQSSQTKMESLRTVVLLVTDGEDDSDDVNGKDNDKDVTLENVKTSAIPVYGILLDNISKKPNDTKIKFTKNNILNSDNSNGYYFNCSTEKDGAIVEQAFTTMDEILRKQTYVVNLKAATNQRVTGRTQMNFSVNNQAIRPASIDYSDYEVDKNAPKVAADVKKDGLNAVTFTLQDEYGVNLSDAKDKSHYIIQTVKDDDSGKKWTIEQINANKNGKDVNVTLIVSDKEFLNGDYEIKIDGIRDESQDQNKMENVTVSFNVEDGLSPVKEAAKDFIQKYWWIFLILIVGIIGAVLVIAIKKKSVKVVEMDLDELNKADSKLIRLTVTDYMDVTRDVDCNVEGSVFVGRSDICNIYFDDDHLSKQHFVIEVTKMGCYIEDLESTNGTFVNGVKMTNRRLLIDGDEITAGREKFVFHVANQSLESDDYFSE